MDNRNPKSYQEIETVEALLNYKSQSVGHENTALHDAILNSDFFSLEKLLNLNRTLPAKSSFLNKQSLGNSALLLALKTGNEKAALLLLKEEGIRIDDHDEHGFQAIHWACMFRMDKVINNLLSLNPNTYIAKSKTNKYGKYWLPAHGILKHITPAMLYQYDWLTQISDLAIPNAEEINDGNNFTRLILTSRSMPFAIENHAFREDRYEATFAKISNDLNGPLAHGYLTCCMTDILFHMRLICRNMVPDPMFDSDMHALEQKYGRSCDRFWATFKFGYEMIAQIRQNLKADQTLIEKLNELQSSAEVEPENKNARNSILTNTFFTHYQHETNNEAHQLIMIGKDLINQINASMESKAKLINEINSSNDFDETNKQIINENLDSILDVLANTAKLFEEQVQLLEQYSGIMRNNVLLHQFIAKRVEKLISFLEDDSEKIKTILNNTSVNPLSKQLDSIYKTQEKLEEFSLKIKNDKNSPLATKP